MTRSLKDILVFIIPTVLVILTVVLTVETSAIDVQLHDTYIVLDKTDTIIVIIGPLIFLTFLSLAVARKFRIPSTNLGLIIGLILITYPTIRIGIILMNYGDFILSDLRALSLEKDSRELLADKIHKKVTLIGTLLGFFITAITLIGFRTYRLLAKSHSLL